MDIFACINSKDIRKYLKQIGYKFDALETAWLIYACKALSYEDKKALWKEVIMTMPDCVVPSRMNCAGSGYLFNNALCFKFLSLFCGSFSNGCSDCKN